MKANEALEILSSDDIYNHIDIGRYSWEEIQEAVDILVRQQHTRTDAFIEKAVSYLNSKLYDWVETTNPNQRSYANTIMKQDFIEDFRSYMKGE